MGHILLEFNALQFLSFFYFRVCIFIKELSINIVVKCYEKLLDVHIIIRD